MLWPPQGIYAKVALNSSADLKGVKIRAYSPTVARMIELMGGQPVTVQAADLCEALLKAAAAELCGWKTSEEKTLCYLDQLKKNKMKVLPASADLQKELLGIDERVTREWLVQAGPDGRQVYDTNSQALKK